jgi:uncharacterized protein (TIGR03067 family)
MRRLIAVVLLATLAPAAPIPKELKKKDDAARFVGRWKPVGTSTMFIEFASDGSMKAWTEATTERSAASYTWTVDPTPTPKRMTWYSDGKPRWEAIYELDSDSLKFLYGSQTAKLSDKVAPDGTYLFEQLTRDTSAK